MRLLAVLAALGRAGTCCCRPQAALRALDPADPDCLYRHKGSSLSSPDCKWAEHPEHTQKEAVAKDSGMTKEAMCTENNNQRYAERFQQVTDVTKQILELLPPGTMTQIEAAEAARHTAHRPAMQLDGKYVPLVVFLYSALTDEYHDDELKPAMARADYKSVAAVKKSIVQRPAQVREPRSSRAQALARPSRVHGQPTTLSSVRAAQPPGGWRSAPPSPRYWHPVTPVEGETYYKFAESVVWSKVAPKFVQDDIVEVVMPNEGEDLAYYTQEDIVERFAENPDALTWDALRSAMLGGFDIVDPHGHGALAELPVVRPARRAVGADGRAEELEW